MADNLLDKASILLTPTAYDNGSMLSIKPENGDGDFDFQRNSAATRVNAQGLVENVQIISPELVSNGNFSQIGTEEVLNGNFSQEGSELITNGDFSNGSTGWNYQLGWTFDNNQAHFENLGTSNKNIWQSVLTTGKWYKLTFEITSISSGYIRNVNSSVTDNTQFSTVGVHTQYFKAASIQLYLKASNDANLSIDNVSVKEVGQNWNLGPNTTIGDGQADFNYTGFSSMIQASPNLIPVVGNTYVISYEITEYTSGTFRLNFGGIETNGSSVGVRTATIKAISTGQLQAVGSGIGFIGSVTNISIKEVGQDWTFGTGWSIGENKAISDASTNSYLNQQV